MPSFRQVAAVVYDGICTFELGIAVEIFGLDRPELEVDWYRLTVCSPDEGPLRAGGGFVIDGVTGLGALEAAGTIVIPGWRDIREPPPEELLDALRQAHQHGARLLSVCSGVFVLAATGLLDGRRATTHWRYTGALRQQYPSIEVDPEVLYVDEGSVLTSAGSAAGLDLCLHLVRRDFGAAVANAVARRLVVPPHRDGGQAQFIESPVEPQQKNRLTELLDWLRRHLSEPHSVASMAHRAAVSPRTFARRFTELTGTTPQRWLARERIIHAQHLLETTDEGIDWIASRAGFSSAQLLRHHFHRQLGTTPSAYRRSFRGGSAPEPAR